MAILLLRVGETLDVGPKLYHWLVSVSQQVLVIAVDSGIELTSNPFT